MNNRTQALLQHVVSIVLVLAVVGLLGWLSHRYKIEADWTAGNRNTLTEASQRLLTSLPGEVRFTAFVYPEAEMKREIQTRVERYQRFKPDIVLEFVDPAKNPQRVRDLNISAAGEVVIEYQERRENLRALSEQTISAALQRLAFTGESWVVFLQGHGERGMDDADPSGLAKFSQTLREKGLKLRGLNLATEPTIPDNAAVLVLATPSQELLEGEVKLIDAWVQRGGNLLWLADPEFPAGLDPLAKTLGATWQNGTGVLLETAALGLPPFIFITGTYPQHPITRGLFDNTLFPLVRGVTASGAGWQPQPFLQSSQEAWLEAGSLDGEIGFDADKGDTQGPITVGLALTRDVAVADAPPPSPQPPPAEGEAPPEPPAPASKPQRAVLLGDGDFVSNAYIDQLGNRQLGINLIQWLVSREAAISVEVPKAPDVALDLPPWVVILIAIGYTFVLPLLLVGFGAARWIMRRRR